jgi:hypothetical protein
MALRTTDTIWEDTVDPTVNDDSTLGLQVGDEWRNSVTGKVFFIADTTPGAAIWVSSTDRLTFKRAMVTCFVGNNGYIQTTSTSWTTRAGFVFPGTDKLGSLSKINAIVWGNAGGGATGADIRIIDVTNAQVICSVLGVGTSATTITDMGVLSNLPSGEALFAVQIRRLGPSGQARVSSITMEY